MNELQRTLELLVYGFIVGYVWHPIWTVSKKIWREAKIATTEWKKPNG
jgi:predicted acyltransferase